jgi:hypothetical protein
MMVVIRYIVLGIIIYNWLGAAGLLMYSKFEAPRALLWQAMSKEARVTVYHRLPMSRGDLLLPILNIPLISKGKSFHHGRPDTRSALMVVCLSQDKLRCFAAGPRPEEDAWTPCAGGIETRGHICGPKRSERPS